MVGILLTALLLCFLPRFPCLSPDESSFSLSYNGGKIMTEPVTVSLLWFGTGWQDAGTEVIRNAITSLTPSRYPVKDNSEVPTLGNWWEILRQYRDGENVPVTDRVDVGTECFYRGPEVDMTRDQVVRIGRSVFNKTSIDGFGGNLTCTGVFEVNDSSMYSVVLSHTVMFLDRKEERELTVLCSGNLDVEVSRGVMVRMAWARAPQKPTDQCSTFFHGDFYLGPPNGDEKIDSLVGYVLAKIAEEVTNRDGRGWISDDGNELTVSSSCASPFQREEAGIPLFMDAQRNVSFNTVGLNGYRYMVQYIWDQKIRNCALKLSETCGTNTVMLEQPKGYLRGGIIVNHTNGLQPYPPNEKCRWKIYYPTAKFISFTFNYLSVTEDQLMICQADSSPAQCPNIESNDENSKKDFKLMGSKVYIEFTSGDYVSTKSRGWELIYSAGLCDGKEDVYDHEGVISYTSSIGFSYVEGLSCQWVLHGKPGTPVTLSFTHINVSKEFDFLAVYNGKMKQMANFSGAYSGSNLPRMNLTGEVMIAFATQTAEGEGWSANFHISSPVDRNKKELVAIIAIILAVVAISFSLAFIALAVLRRRRKHRNRMDSIENLMSIRVQINREENQIGEGPSSIVYRAVSTDGSSVAVKSPKATSQTELEEEILLKSSSHPNIISLMGCAQDGIQRQYLVFEFMARGSLSWNLRERGETLDWEKRLAIALQISSAIQMLHMYLNPPIYHGNITSENILLDEFYNAKLGGFGGANYCQNDGSHHEKPSEMAEDIRSFGLLLVELLRGEPLVTRHASDLFRSPEEINELMGGQEYLDARLDIPKEQCKIMGLAKLGDIAKWCIIGSQTVGRYETSPKIDDVMLSLKQVKQMFCSAVSS